MEAICNCCCPTLCHWTAHLHETAQVAGHLWCFDAKHFADLAKIHNRDIYIYMYTYVYLYNIYIVYIYCNYIYMYIVLYIPSVLDVNDCMIAPFVVKWLLGGIPWFWKDKWPPSEESKCGVETAGMYMSHYFYLIWWAKRCIQNAASLNDNDVMSYCSISPTWSSSHLLKPLIKSQSRKWYRRWGRYRKSTQRKGVPEPCKWNVTVLYRKLMIVWAFISTTIIVGGKVTSENQNKLKHWNGIYLRTEKKEVNLSGRSSK